MKFDNLDYLVTDRVAEITMRRVRVNAFDHGLAAFNEKREPNW